MKQQGKKSSQTKSLGPYVLITEFYDSLQRDFTFWTYKTLLDNTMTFNYITVCINIYN